MLPCSLQFPCTSLILLVLLVGSTICVQAGDGNNTLAADDQSTPEILGSSLKPPKSPRPTIYTYFQHIDASNRTTGMTNDEDNDLVSFWKEQWEDAGYTAVVLTSETVYSPMFEDHDASNNMPSFSKERYEAVRVKLDAMPLDDFGKILFRRWLAMAAVGGGWFSDYDNFPLWNMESNESPGQPQMMTRENVKLPGKMTVYDILSPTLASGSGTEWLETLDALLDDTIQNCPPLSQGTVCFYTDSLAIHSLKANHQPMAPKTDRKVALPFDKNDPVSSNDPNLCSARAFRNRFTVHFGPGALQRGRHVPPKARHPKHRSKLARSWLDRWKGLCHEKDIDRGKTEETI